MTHQTSTFNPSCWITHDVLGLTAVHAGITHEYKISYINNVLSDNFVL